MISFAFAVFFLLITPGPGVLTAAGVGAAFGFRQGILFLVGLWFGTNAVAIAIISGLGALLYAHQNVRLILSVVSLLYLLYLGFKIAFSGTKVAFLSGQKPPGIFGTK